MMRSGSTALTGWQVLPPIGPEVVAAKDEVVAGEVTSVGDPSINANLGRIMPVHLPPPLPGIDGDELIAGQIECANMLLDAYEATRAARLTSGLG